MIRKLIIIEDSEATRSRIRDVAESMDNIRVVAEAADAHSAIGLITTHDPDLITLDIKLGNDSSGLDVLNFLRYRSRPPQVIVLSSSVDHNQVDLHMLPGASHALDKMMDFDRLAEAFGRGAEAHTA